MPHILQTYIILSTQSEITNKTTRTDFDSDPSTFSEKLFVKPFTVEKEVLIQKTEFVVDVLQDNP